MEDLYLHSQRCQSPHLLQVSVQVFAEIFLLDIDNIDTRSLKNGSLAGKSYSLLYSSWTYIDRAGLLYIVCIYYVRI